jgi:hypothetical protein
MRRLARSAAGRRTWGLVALALCAVLLAIAPGRLPRAAPAAHAPLAGASTWSASAHGTVERALFADRPQLRAADGNHRPYLVAALSVLVVAGLTTRWPRAAATSAWLPLSTWSKAGFRERAPPRSPDSTT